MTRKRVRLGITADARRHVLRETARMAAPYRADIVRALVLALLQTAGVVAGPLLIRHGIDQGVVAGDLTTVAWASGLFLVAAVVAYFAARGAILSLIRAGESFLRDLRTAVFAHELDLGMDVHDRVRTGTLVSRMTSDIGALQQVVDQGLVNLLTQGLVLVGSLVAMIAVSPPLALIVLVVAPPLWARARWFQRASDRAYLDLREHVQRTVTEVQEGLSGVRVVQAFAQEERWLGRFDETNEAQYSAHLETQRIAALFTPVIELGSAVAVVLVIVAGGWLTTSGWASVGTVAAFILYLQRVFDPIQQLSQLFNELQSALAALVKIHDLLDTSSALEDPDEPDSLPTTGQLRLDDVVFGYGDDTVIHGITMSVAQGERVVIVGSTGAGKSTLAKLMVRFYDPDEGTVSFGGVPLGQAGIADVRRRIVLFPQEGYLFSTTVRENIRVARPDATDADIEGAVSMLGLQERIAALPDGLDTLVRERGARLSAGERQLVSLLRLALLDPRVIILDEATSSVDPASEALIEHALARLTRGRALIVIAHRLSTASRADRVILVDAGRILEQGSHEDLLAQGGQYAALFGAWAGDSGSDLANRSVSP